MEPWYSKGHLCVTKANILTIVSLRSCEILNLKLEVTQLGMAVFGTSEAGNEEKGQPVQYVSIKSVKFT